MGVATRELVLVHKIYMSEDCFVQYKCRKINTSYTPRRLVALQQSYRRCSTFATFPLHLVYLIPLQVMS